MAKKSLLQIFVEEAYSVVKVLHLQNGFHKKSSYQMWKIFIISLKENIVFVKLFVIYFDSNKLASFSEFQSGCTNTFGSTWVLTFEICIQGSLLHK